jgi:nitrogen PTS system EIIA component
MSELADFLGAGTVSASLAVPSRKALFQHIGQLASRAYGLDASLVAERLTERERLGSTGFGNGIAIPHGKIDGLDRVVAVFCQLSQPVDFQAVDGLPVDVVFCLLSPPDAGAAHLKALAQASRWLRDAAFVANIRGAGSSDALLAVLEGLEARDAA